MTDHSCFLRLVACGTRDLIRCVQWPKHLSPQEKQSSEVPEHMTVTPAVVSLLPIVNCDHFNLDHVETLVSLAGDIDGSRALESGWSRMALSISSESYS